MFSDRKERLRTLARLAKENHVMDKKPNYLTSEELKMSADEVNLQIVLGLQSCKTKNDVCELLEDVRLHERILRKIEK